MLRRSSRTLLAILLLTSATIGMAAAGDAGVPPARSVTEVKIDNFTMSPQVITVAPGTEVRWTNADDIPHTVVSEDRVFKSKVLDTSDQFTYTFDKAGTYKYFCSLHPHMTGTVVVK